MQNLLKKNQQDKLSSKVYKILNQTQPICQAAAINESVYENSTKGNNLYYNKEENNGVSFNFRYLLRKISNERLFGIIHQKQKDFYQEFTPLNSSRESSVKKEEEKKSKIIIPKLKINQTAQSRQRNMGSTANTTRNNLLGNLTFNVFKKMRSHSINYGNYSQRSIF